MLSLSGVLKKDELSVMLQLYEQENMVDATIYFVYLPSKNLNAAGWIMHIFKFDNRRELFSVQLGMKIGGKGIAIQSLI